MFFIHKNYFIYTIYSVVIILLLNALIYIYLSNEGKYQEQNILKIYQNLMKTLIIDELNPSKVFNYEALSNEEQLNLMRIYFNNSIYTTQLPKNPVNKSDTLLVFNLQDLVKKFAKDQFYYSIGINNTQITGNSFIDPSTYLFVEHKMTKGSNLNISLRINESSALIQGYRNRIVNHIIILLLTSIFVFITSVVIIFFLVNKAIRNKQILENLQNKYNTLLEKSEYLMLFDKTNKNYIITCYNNSKNILSSKFLSMRGEVENNEEYLPIVLNSDKAEKVKTHIIDLEPIILNLTNYFTGYKALSNIMINLDISKNTNMIRTSLDSNLFNQVITSLFFNILYFNKDIDNNRYIKFLFKEKSVLCVSNGFLLDLDLAIRYSEKIFYETGNLFILNLGQIFILLKKYKLGYTVFIEQGLTNIELQFSNVKDHRYKKDDIKDQKIVDFSEFKQRNQNV